MPAPWWKRRGGTAPADAVEPACGEAGEGERGLAAADYARKGWPCCQTTHGRGFDEINALYHIKAECEI